MTKEEVCVTMAALSGCIHIQVNHMYNYKLDIVEVYCMECKEWYPINADA